MPDTATSGALAPVNAMPGEGPDTVVSAAASAELKLAAAIASHQRTQTILLLGVYLLLACFAMYFAGELILPILVAILLKLVLAPLVGRIARLRIPEPIGAGIVLAMLTLSIAYGAYALSAPAAEWVTRIPERLYILREHLRQIEGPLDFLRQAGKSIAQLSEIADPSQPAVVVQQAAPAVVAEGQPIGPTLVLSETADIVISIGSTLVLLYFLLASGDMFLRKMVTVLPTLHDKKQAVEIARQVQTDVSHYLVTISIINLSLGTVLGLTMWALGMPSPLLWGAMLTLLNFIPFLGPAVCFVVVALASFMSFPNWHDAILPPLALLLYVVIEGHFITPAVVARRLVLNSVAVFVALLFCGWIWGIVGVLVSVPLLAVIKILCDRIRPLMPVGEFLGR